MVELCIFFFFFFQAEDGIRDIGVTGVQTCALPICFPSPYADINLANHFADLFSDKITNLQISLDLL